MNTTTVSTIRTRCTATTGRFSSEHNEKFLDIFFGRAAGEGNLIVLSPENTDRLAALFDSLLHEELSSSERYIAFFEVMGILNSGAKKGSNAGSQ